MPRVRIAAEAPESSSIEAEIARLRGLDLKALRARWRTSFGQDAPSHFARHLLFAMLAYSLQAEAMGDLDVDTVRFLKQIDLAPSTGGIPMPLSRMLISTRSPIEVFCPHPEPNISQVHRCSACCCFPFVVAMPISRRAFSPFGIAAPQLPR